MVSDCCCLRTDSRDRPPPAPPLPPGIGEAVEVPISGIEDDGPELLDAKGLMPKT